MKTKFAVGTLAVAAMFAAACSTSFAVTLTVQQRGDHGWQSRDTRSAAGTSLVSPADDAAIDQVIKFGDAPAGGPEKALNLITPTSNAAKASLGVANLSTGFDTGDALLSFVGEYQWYTQGAPTFTNRISPLKIGIQSPNYGSVPAGATRTGDNDWDFLLVQLPPSIAATWNTEELSFTSGNWYVVQRGGGAGATFTQPISGAGTGETLEDIYNGGTGFGGNADLASLFSSSAKISVIEFGLGSGQQNANNFVSYLQTNIYNGGDRVVFGVPEPASILIAGMAASCVGLCYRRRRLA